MSLLEDGEREAVLTSFAGRLRPGGLLFLDVREAGESERRADGRWRASVVELPGGRRLRFTSRPSWCAGRIVVDESYALLGGRGESVSVHDYRFQMRPWTATELRTRLGDAGFDHIEILPGVGRRTPDRLFVVARAPAASVG